MKEYVIIIGAMKAGTTTLFDLLAAHPEIAPARDKEPGFFALDEVWDRGFAWYDGLFDFDPARHRYRLEGSTDYTKAPFVDADVWARMTARPDVSVRLLYILREPVARLESHARHVQRTRREIGRRDSPRPDHGLDAGPSPVSLAVSDYAAQLDRYAEARAQGRLHLLSLEALRAEPEATMAAVFAFLGLAPHMPATVEASNVAGTHRRMPGYWDWLWRMAPALALAKRLIPKDRRDRIKDGLRRPERVGGRFRFDPQERAALETLFAPGLERLRREHGLDLRRGPADGQDGAEARNG